MPEPSALHIAIVAVMTVIGAAFGWVLRGRRSAQEKAAVSTLWHEQIDAQRAEHDRLTVQNKGLMEQISQYQASNKDAKNRARELSAAVQEAFARRDELQREIKDIRGHLEVALTERDQLQSSVDASDDSSVALAAKDQRIGKLQRELANWQSRLPPLIEKYRQRNDDAERLEAELADARSQLQVLLDSRAGRESRAQVAGASEAPNTHEDVSNDANDAAAPLNGARDALQAIKGVGPAIEKTLNEMGIFNYQQIADMSEYDIDRIAKRLKGFRSRIYREDWIGQARELCHQSAGN